MGFNNPSVADFKTQFARDFPYGSDPNIAILDSDITSAFVATNININQALFPDQGSYTYGYNLLAAHYLVVNIRSSSQGINGQFNFLQAGKGAGAVNETFDIPDRIKANPDWAMLCKTNYGAQYLQIVLPQLCGQTFTLPGTVLGP